MSDNKQEMKNMFSDDFLQRVFNFIDGFGPDGVDIEAMPDPPSGILAAGYLGGLDRVFIVGGGGKDNYIISTTRPDK